MEFLSLIDWSRAQFALTAFYHWLFVPLTLGLGVTVAVMETIYYRKVKNGTKSSESSEEWLRICKFWMRLFGINFAIGVATGIILEFEFGTNWSNYSWFVGDIFGAPLAIEGIFAFFMESTFFAVMFFGWKKFSPLQHLSATWLTAFGASLSAWWILVANSWMQYPVGMEFDPDTMRNVMNDFAAVALSPVAVNKFMHAVFSGWCLAGVFVVGVSAYFVLKGRDMEMAVKSVKVGAAVGVIGILMTMFTGDGTAVEVTKCQPMKLAAMEGLYQGQQGTKLIGVAVLNPNKEWNDEQDPTVFEVSIPYGLSILGRHDYNAFIPGIKDIIEGKDMVDGKVVNTVPYAERIQRGKQAQTALAAYDKARKAGDTAAQAEAKKQLDENYKYFGYGYFNDVKDAIPPVGLTFYPFHIMVIIGGWLMMFLIVVLALSWKKPEWLRFRWKNIPLFPLLAFVTMPLVWICSECGWMVAELGRQPWAIQDIMPVQAAVSSLSTGQVITTFCIFLVLFATLLCAEVNIMVKQIKKGI